MASLSPQEEVQRLQNQIDIETRIKDGAENLLSVFDLKLASTAKQDLRKQIVSELDSANTKIAALTSELDRWRQMHATTSQPYHVSNSLLWVSKVNRFSPIKLVRVDHPHTTPATISCQAILILTMDHHHPPTTSMISGLASIPPQRHPLVVSA